MKHQVTEHQLAHGFKGLVLNVPGSEVVDLIFSVKAGFLFSDPAKYELPHVLEHAMFSGAGQFPTALEFKMAIEQGGAALGAATTSTDIIYSYQCVAAEAERILDLACLPLVDPKLPPSSFKSEVSNIREELLRNTTNHQHTATTNLYAKVMPKSRQTERIRLNQLPQISRADALKFYRQTHLSRNTRFFLAGDLSDGGQALLKRLEQNLSTMLEGRDFSFPVEPVVHLSEPVVERRPIDQIYYNFTALADSSVLNDRQQAALKLASDLLTGGWQSWVYGQARERGLAYSVASRFIHLPHVAQFLFFSHVSETNAAALFELIQSQMSRLMEGQFKTSDLDFVKGQKEGTFIRYLQTSGNLLDWYYQHYVHRGVVRPPEQYLKNLSSITKDDVVEALGVIKQAGRFSLSLVGDLPDRTSNKLYNSLEPIWG